MSILSSVGSIQRDKESLVEYEEISSTFNNFKSLRFKGATPPKTINPAQYRKLDNFSKLVSVVTAQALEDSGLNIKSWIQVKWEYYLRHHLDLWKLWKELKSKLQQMVMLMCRLQDFLYCYECCCRHVVYYV